MVAHPIIIAIALLAALSVGVASFVPLPNTYNVRVTVNSVEVPVVVGTLFSISSVSGTTLSRATVIDWGSLSFSPPGVQQTWTMTVCVANHCSTKSASQWFPSIPVLNGGSITASNSFDVGYVPGGEQTISVALSNGVSSAHGSGTMCVGC